MNQDTKNQTLFIELRAATGGDDAARFCGELARAYLRAAAARGWTAEVVSWEDVGRDYVRSAVLRISGRGAALLTEEAGGHRITREPKNDRQGRRHTSIVTVAAMPAAPSDAVEIAEGDLRIEIKRGSGNGGQNRNKRETAVKVTHIPTGITADIAEQRTQGQNKETALELVAARVAARARGEQADAHASLRRAQVGTGELAERRRTYAEKEGTVVDHRTGRQSRYRTVLAGDFDALWR